MTKIIKRLFILTACILVTVLASCGEIDYTYSGANVGQLQAPTVDRNSAEYREKYSTLERYDETVTVDVAVINYPLEAGVKENLTPQKNTFNAIAKEVLNIDLNYVVVAKTSNYESNLNLYIADNGLPDMFYVTNSAMYSELQKDGMLADLSDVFWYLNDELLDNYLTYFPELLPTVMVEGGLYAFPTITNNYQSALSPIFPKDCSKCLFFFLLS